jgi:hypothetical protein
LSALDSAVFDTLGPAAQRVLAPDTPARLLELAAKGVLPGARPAEIATVLVVLSSHALGDIARTATATLAALPAPVLSGVLAAPDLPAVVIDALARAYGTRIDVLEKLLPMPSISQGTLESVTRAANESVAELVATNEARLLAHPRLIELLYLNKNTRMSTADRLVELAVRAQLELHGIPTWEQVKAAIAGELIPEATAEPSPDDLLFREVDALATAVELGEEEEAFREDEVGEEVPEDRVLPLFQAVLNMNVSQKVRRAALGSKAERAMLVRDRNKVVASAVAHSPMLQLGEVESFTKSRNISDEVLRIIAKSPQWSKSYSVKRNLVENPKTPANIAIPLVTQLREADLKSLAKSKNVPGMIQDAARRHLSRRK